MRTRVLLAWAPVALIVAWAIGCGSDDSPGGTTSTGGTGGEAGTAGTAGTAGAEDAAVEAQQDVISEPEAGNDLPPPICTKGTLWAAGTKTFQEAGASWGLDVLAAEGVRISAVDFDGDGWTDLIVRKTGGVPDDFTPASGDAGAGKRTTWLLRNNGKHGFEDVTQSSGLRKNRTETDPNKGRPGEVIAFGDVDNDGDLDSYTGLAEDSKNPTDETSELMLNQGNGTFELGSADSPVRGELLPAADAPAAAAFLDFNRDGNLDLWIPETAVGNDPQQNRLYQGDGKGGFLEVTAEQGLETKSWVKVPDLNEAKAHTHSWSGAACDLNNDGNPELLAASYGRAPNHLWQNTGSEGGFKFLNRSIESGYAFDDRQDWSDNESARCWCKLHPTDDGCSGVPAPKYISCTKDSDAFRWVHTQDREPWRLGGNSAATICADIDNDGWVDLLTNEIVHWDVGSSSDPAELLLNTKEKDIRFTRPGNDVTGLARKHSATGWDEGIMTSAAFDLDNDGWLDVYLGDSDYPQTKGLLYHQDSPGKFSLMTLADSLNHHRSHGVAVADFDHDGDLDLVVGHSLARCSGYTDCYKTGQIRYFENVFGQAGNFVQITLQGGTGTNRAAIGARVTATAGGVTQTRDVGGGHGHFGAQDDLTVHFGLGTACEAEITIRWPDAALTTEKFTLPAGYRFSITQGGKPKVLWARAQP